MIIRVLPELENREQWLAFMRRDMPYCLVENPECMLDFQTTFLQLTLFPQTSDPVRYTLGSRRSMEPAWNLIKGCGWRLSVVLEGVKKLDFSSNVRDNHLLQLQGELTARKSFPRDRHMIAPSASGLLHPVAQYPESWDHQLVSRLLANRQYRALQLNLAEHHAPEQMMLSLQQEPQRWRIEQDGQQLHLLLDDQPYASLIPQPGPAIRRLQSTGVF
ncbi:hypothetical protein [Nitrincola alkalilacustris]|uniref:hypothetical protein n=1 Tax=Nitrincola alkalilacustris TaxID=1571224 RepID=UPI00124D5430|nr:hypothetical protein [Nitrincola alkalilacustris]